MMDLAKQKQNQASDLLNLKLLSAKRVCLSNSKLGDICPRATGVILNVLGAEQNLDLRTTISVIVD